MHTLYYVQYAHTAGTEYVKTETNEELLIMCIHSSMCSTHILLVLNMCEERQMKNPSLCVYTPLTNCSLLSAYTHTKSSSLCAYTPVTNCSLLSAYTHTKSSSLCAYTLVHAARAYCEYSTETTPYVSTYVSTETTPYVSTETYVYTCIVSVHIHV